MFDNQYYIEGFNILEFAEVDSTMNVAKNYDNKTVIVAKKQNGGKGKSNRKWESPEGNLYFSIVLDIGKGRDFSNLTFITSLALKKAIKSLDKNSSGKIELKWPNDVLLNKKKIAGILLEYDKNLIIGVGINIKYFPENTMFSATSLLNEDIILDYKEIFKEFIIQFNFLFSRWINSGFKNIKNEWLENAYNFKKKIKAGETIGIFEDLLDDGTLVLKTDNGIKHIKSSDIF